MYLSIHPSSHTLYAGWLNQLTRSDNKTNGPHLSLSIPWHAICVGYTTAHSIWIAAHSNHSLRSEKNAMLSVCCVPLLSQCMLSTNDATHTHNANICSCTSNRTETIQKHSCGMLNWNKAIRLWINKWLKRKISLSLPLFPSYFISLSLSHCHTLALLFAFSFPCCWLL